MATSGFTGISYPFRVNTRGGCSMSTTSATDPTHIAESLTQIFGTNYLERPMESDVYTTVATLLFEPNDRALQQVLKTRMAVDIARLEPRVHCNADDIDFEVEESHDGVEYLYATIHYEVIKYNTQFTARVKVGEINHEQKTNR